jgi:hypothetical protein
MAQLKGGTTGQILSKTSATDMAFTWITNDVGDITAVNTTAPLAGGGTSGALTLSIASATTAVVGAVQLSDSTSTTSSVLAATPTAVKSSYDLAAAAIPKSTVTTAGDVIYATGSSSVTRLGIGTTGQVLTVASGVPSWATPAGGGGKVLQVVQGTTTTRVDIATTTFTDTGLTATITPTSATSKILVLASQWIYSYRSAAEAGGQYRLLRGATAVWNAPTGTTFGVYTGGALSEIQMNLNVNYLDSPATTSSITYKTQGNVATTANSAETSFNKVSNTSTITLLEIGA